MIVDQLALLAAAPSFWSNVRLCGAGPDDCWEWAGTRLPAGYGYVRFRGVTTGAHRHAFELANSISPCGLVVRHHCDNPPCCNPAHLALGTVADNIADKLRRGRHPRGDRCSFAKLSNAQVAAIRAAYAAGGTTQARLAVAHGVSREHIGAIIRHKFRKAG